uniref:Uncharacterized protein LOC111131612 n=1 Tax=Crassostrea virginica TaxID=6565 RepID=A0A8B8E6A2_CRAVI|nr:uncharacterized protein LOC111131612 [Crassostrea virginica]
MGTASREVIIAMEEEKKSPANLPYCLSCLSLLVCGTLCGLVTYVMAYKAEQSKENGDIRKYRVFKSFGVVLGVLGILFGCSFLTFYYIYVYPVWYRYVYFMQEPEYNIGK